MLYNRKVIGIIWLFVMLTLTACSRNTRSLSIQSGNGVKDTSVLLDYNESSVENPKEYLASKNDGSLNFFDDYDSSISLCNDAFDEFIRAIKDDDKADFGLFIDNPLLREYMQYRIDNHIYAYDDSKHRFYVKELEFYDDYALIKGILSTYSGKDSRSAEGETYFIIKNINGKLSITDWYWDGKDSPDIILRGQFSIENNLNYWDNPEEYTKVLEKIRG